nr:hypothetical protein [Tanacetum cinerariifolium]
MVMSGSQRSKEDDVQKISTSVFVTNFPDGTKAGKRFSFVRFIKVLDIDRLINNLCMVWVGRYKIHANVARFQREPLHKQSNKVNNKGTNNVNHGAKGMANSYAHVVKGNQVQNVGKEGYVNIDLKFMGWFWVMVVFQDDETKKIFQFNLVVGSWFSQIIQAHNDFVIDEGLYGWRLRAFHVSGGLEIHLAISHVDGVRAIEVPGWVPDFEEDGEEGYDVNDGSHEDDMYGGVSKNLKDVEGESDREEVIETKFEEVLNKKRDGKNIDDKHEDSLNYPPGFTPNEDGDVPVEKVDNWSDENRVNDGQEDGVCVGQHVHERVEVLNDTHESTCYGHFKKSKVPRKDGSILELIDDLVNVGQTAELADLDGVIDKGEGSDADGHRRRKVVRLIQEVEKVDAIPISLVGSLYKVIAKVLANRLVTVLDDIVDEFNPLLIFKVDFEKAYDLVRWDFIDDILRRFGFGEKWYVFYRASGLRINMNKSNLMGISVDSNKVKHAAAKIGASKYGIYSCAFFNGADVSSKKPSWVRWKSVLAAKDVGDLEVSSLFALNRALMFTWVWRFFSQKNSLWVRVVKALHGEDEKIGKKVQPMYPSTWLNIINEIESLKLHGIDLVSFITPKLGNGANTSFLDVAWCGDIAFKNLVRRLYALEFMKNIEVSSKLSHGGLEFFLDTIREVEWSRHNLRG